MTVSTDEKKLVNGAQILRFVARSNNKHVTC